MSMQYHSMNKKNSLHFFYLLCLSHIHYTKINLNIQYPYIKSVHGYWWCKDYWWWIEQHPSCDSLLVYDDRIKIWYSDLKNTAKIPLNMSRLLICLSVAINQISIYTERFIYTDVFCIQMLMHMYEFRDIKRRKCDRQNREKQYCTTKIRKWKSDKEIEIESIKKEEVVTYKAMRTEKHTTKNKNDPRHWCDKKNSEQKMNYS